MSEPAAHADKHLAPLSGGYPLISTPSGSKIADAILHLLLGDTDAVELVKALHARGDQLKNPCPKHPDGCLVMAIALARKGVASADVDALLAAIAATDVNDVEFIDSIVYPAFINACWYRSIGPEEAVSRVAGPCGLTESQAAAAVTILDFLRKNARARRPRMSMETVTPCICRCRW